MIRWLRAHKFESHLAAFLLMILSSVGLYIAVDGGWSGVIILFIGVFVVGNLIAMFVK